MRSVYPGERAAYATRWCHRRRSHGNAGSGWTYSMHDVTVRCVQERLKVDAGTGSHPRSSIQPHDRRLRALHASVCGVNKDQRVHGGVQHVVVEPDVMMDERKPIARSCNASCTRRGLRTSKLQLPYACDLNLSKNHGRQNSGYYKLCLALLFS